MRGWDGNGMGVIVGGTGGSTYKASGAVALLELGRSQNASEDFWSVWKIRMKILYLPLNVA